jgi:hypothetical protein
LRAERTPSACGVSFKVLLRHRGHWNRLMLRQKQLHFHLRFAAL